MTVGEYLEQLRSNFYRSALSTEEGRFFLWSLLEECCVFGCTFMGEKTHSSAFAEGKRAVGLRVLSEVLDADPSALENMRNANRLRRELLKTLKSENTEKAEEDDIYEQR